jgi:hypothetical protein
MMDIPIYNEQLTGLGEFNFEKRKDFAAVLPMLYSQMTITGSERNWLSMKVTYPKRFLSLLTLQKTEHCNIRVWDS